MRTRWLGGGARRPHRHARSRIALGYKPYPTLPLTSWATLVVRARGQVDERTRLVVMDGGDGRAVALARALRAAGRPRSYVLQARPQSHTCACPGNTHPTRLQLGSTHGAAVPALPPARPRELTMTRRRLLRAFAPAGEKRDTRLAAAPLACYPRDTDSAVHYRCIREPK